MSGAWTPYDGRYLLPVRELFRLTRIFLSDLMFVKSTLTGHEVVTVPHTSIGDSAYANVVEVDIIRNSGQHSVSTGTPLYQGRLYTLSDTGSNFSPSYFLRIPSTTVGQYEEGGILRNQPMKSPQATKERATASSRSSGRSTGARKAQNKSYSCAFCDEKYAQIQGVGRHIRTKHHPSSCLFCDFKWGRPENYRSHLTKRHGLGVAALDEILGKPAGSRRSTTIIGRDLPQNVSPPAIERQTGTA